MNKTNIQICNNCKYKNPLYRETCLECGHQLRKRVVNIDLWSTIWKIFDNPIVSLKNIIFARHKNFVVFLLILLSVKLYSLFLIVKFYTNPLKQELHNANLNSITITLIFFITIIFFTKLITFFINRTNGKLTRFKDNIAIITYSFVPLILISSILFPVEYGIFGKQWFVSNPSPFVIKKNAAYMLFTIETIVWVWSLFNLSLSFYIQSGSKSKSILFLILFLFLLFGVVQIIPVNIL